MKLRSIKFNNHVALTDYDVGFNIVSGPQIHYLVGNNGSGKSQILSAIYNSVSGNSPDTSTKYSLVLTFSTSKADLNYIELPTEQEHLKTDGDIKDLTFTSLGNGGYRRNLKFNIDGSYAETDISIPNISLCPIVYSEVEINFAKQKVASATGQIVDDNRPKEKSDNLNAVIPQLLVDIKTEDDAKIAQAYRANKDRRKLDAEIDALDLKMPRFADAYNLVMRGSKHFDGIYPDGKGYNINFKDKRSVVVDLSDLSSGEKQIIYRLGFILKNLDTIKNGIVLIDEPEISLHPEWQIKFKEILLRLFRSTEIQIIIATHSPYIFHHFNDTKEECLYIDRTKNSSKVVQIDVQGNIENPSPNLISYEAFGLVSENLHIELYTRLMIISKKKTVSSFNDWLVSKNPRLAKVNRSKTGAKKFLGQYDTNETLPIWIRNKLSHPDITDRKDFRRTDLKKSINLMLKMLRK